MNRSFRRWLCKRFGHAIRPAIARMAYAEPFNDWSGGMVSYSECARCGYIEQWNGRPVASPEAETPTNG